MKIGIHRCLIILQANVLNVFLAGLPGISSQWRVCIGGYQTKKRLFHGYCNIIRIVVVVLRIRPKFPHICYSVDYRKISSDGLAQLKFQMSYSAVQCGCPIIREIMRRTGRFQRNVSVNRRVSRSRFVFQNFCRNLVLFFWLRPIFVRFRSISVVGRRSLAMELAIGRF